MFPRSKQRIYRKKALVEAYQYGVEEVPDYILEQCDLDKKVVHTLEGDMKFENGDYLLINCRGDQHAWCVQKEIFEKTYSEL